MSDSESNNKGKGFKGLRSLSANSPGPVAVPPAIPERNGAKPPSTPARENSIEPAVQPPPAQSQTAASPLRGLMVGVGIISVLIIIPIWFINQSPSSNSYTTPTATDYQPSPIVGTAPAAPPPSPAITKPPVGYGLVLTSDQIRYCVYEARRIKGAEKVVDQYDQASVNKFNAMVSDYNNRCGNFRYRQGALEPIEREANRIQHQLEQEGRARMIRGQH